MFVKLPKIKNFALLIFIVISSVLCGQGTKGVSDTTQIRLLNEKTKICIDANSDSAVIYNQQSLTLSEKIKVPNFDGYSHKAFILIRKKKFDEALPVIQQAVKISNESKQLKEQGKANYLYALWYEGKNDINNSLKYAELALKIREKAKDTLQLINSLSQLGRIYKDNSKVTEGLNFFLRAARLAEQIGDSSHIFSSYINLGTLYQKTKDQKKALEFYYKALEINKRDNDTNGYAICYLKLGSLWMTEKNDDSAYYYLKKCVELHRIRNDEAGLCTSLTKLAGVLNNKGKYEEAIRCFDEVIQTARKIDHLQFLKWGLSGRAGLLLKLKKYPEALKLAKEASEIDDHKSDYSFVSSINKLISDIYYSTGDYKNAYAHHVLYKAALDTILAQNDVKKQTELKLSYEFDQIQEKQKEEALAKEIENNVRIESEKKQRYFLWALLGLALVVVVVAVRSYMNKKKSNVLLEKKNVELDSQKKLVEEKNKEISDSINYAKHIQTACLPDKPQLDACFENYYLLFKPRDIVSGDFFWTAQTENKVMLAVADCTGHGVPGAIMSMIGSILLNETFHVKNMYSPENVLKELNRIVKLTLKQEGDSTSKDGMDIAFCLWDKDLNKLFYSGANRPLYIVKNDGQFIEYKATKLPIGGTTALLQDYDLNVIQLDKGDRIVITTDGFADQFGGDRSKKINTKKFKEKLVGIHNLSSEEQKQELNRYFENWRGQLEQTDDVLVFSFKV